MGIGSLPRARPGTPPYPRSGGNGDKRKVPEPSRLQDLTKTYCVYLFTLSCSIFAFLWRYRMSAYLYASLMNKSGCRRNALIYTSSFMFTRFLLLFLLPLLRLS